MDAMSNMQSPTAFAESPHVTLKVSKILPYSLVISFIHCHVIVAVVHRACLVLQHSLGAFAVSRGDLRYILAKI